MGECKDFVAVFTETVLFIALTCITKRFLLSILYGFECCMAGLAQSKELFNHWFSLYICPSILAAMTLIILFVKVLNFLNIIFKEENFVKEKYRILYNNNFLTMNFQNK